MVPVQIVEFPWLYVVDLVEKVSHVLLLYYLAVLWYELVPILVMLLVELFVGFVEIVWIIGFLSLVFLSVLKEMVCRSSNSVSVHSG